MTSEYGSQLLLFRLGTLTNERGYLHLYPPGGGICSLVAWLKGEHVGLRACRNLNAELIKQLCSLPFTRTRERQPGPPLLPPSRVTVLVKEGVHCLR